MQQSTFATTKAKFEQRWVLGQRFADPSLAVRRFEWAVGKRGHETVGVDAGKEKDKNNVADTSHV